MSAGVGDGGASIEGTIHQPGAGGAGVGGGGNGPGKPDDGDTSIPFRYCQFYVTGCPKSPGGPAAPTPTYPPVTLSDIVRFQPDPGVDHMQPQGWMVVGLDTNFYATGGPQVKSGQLLGLPASVRFTPMRWNWAYGDGTTASRAATGTTWESQHISEFDPTPTSHVYREGGTYYIDLSIDYRVEYTFADSGWLPLDGIITLPANRLQATAGDAKTVLVELECTKNPTGPGC